MKVAFMVAEKPSLAASLANILSNNQAASRRGSNGVCTVHEWKGMLFGQTVLFRMTSVCGHVLTIDFDARFNNWDKVDPLELFSCPTERKEATPKLRMQSFLAQEARGCDYLILWLDCDKEGENICFEVIDAVRNSIKRIHSSDVVWRAKFSSITEKDIKAAMYNLGKPNKNEALSVDARQELDLRIGCAFTRFQTKFFHRKYGNLDSSLISFGPCQTPTLGFCVERHDQIQTFKPEPYWVLQVTVMTSDKREIPLSYQTGRIFERDAAKALLQKFKSIPSLKVTSIVSKEKSKSRPAALNTVELMRAASAGLGIGPHHTMSVAERLYTQGYISYPRTETTRYPENFDLFEVVNIFVHNREYGEYACQILTNGVNRPKKGVDVGDHPPITPMKSATCVELDGDCYKIYDYIVRHFLGTLSGDCKYLSTTTTFMAENDTFTFVGEMLLDPGYTAIMTWQGIAKNKVSPNVSVGDVVPIHNVQLTDHKTTPPDYLTESELITLMEKHGIGTDASIPVHINNISQRNYVTVANGRRLVPTNLGIILVHGYQKIDRELVEPTTRSKMEEQLNLIACGEADFLKVLGEVIKLFKKKYQFFTKNIEDMDSLFEVSFTPLADSGKALSRCGKCRRYMKYIQARPNRLHCSHCNETYNLPQNGNIRIFKELRCPVDDFELLTWSSGSRGKSFPLCPYCYNNPPYPDMKKNSGCNMCIHPTCPQAIYSIGIASCINCDDGILVLDPSSGPKWKVLCNRCDIIMPVFDDAQKVVVDKKACKCGAQLIKVEYKETYDIPQYSGKRNRSLSCEDYSDWNPAKKPNSILSSSSGKQSSSFQPDSSQSSEYIHSLLQNHVKHGAEIVKLLKEAELHHFELEDVTAALAQCGDENPIKWLTENWNKMIDTVVTLATNYGREQVENTIGTISSIEAQTALRLHNGDIWAAVTECIRQRQTKYTKLMSRGLYSREDVVTCLTANHGNLEAAYKELSKSQLKPFLMKIWGPPQGLDNDSGDISKLHYKDYEYETDDRSVELPNDKQNFNRIQSWLDTASTSASEFDEYLRFEEALTTLRNQSNSNNCIKFSPHLGEQNAAKVFQNENLTRYNSCDNLKFRFNNILNRKQFYASTDVLSAPKVDNKYHKSQLNHFEMENGRKNPIKVNFNNSQQPHELEQYLMNKNAKRYGIVENDKRNEINEEYTLGNFIENYLNNEFARQEMPQDAHFISSQVTHSNQGQATRAYSIQGQVAQHEVDLNDGLVEKKLAPETNFKVTSNETVSGNTGYEAKPGGMRPENYNLASFKPDLIHEVQNLSLSTLHNNSEYSSAAVNPLEIHPKQIFDLEEKFESPVEAGETKKVEDNIKAKNSSSNVTKDTQTAEGTLQNTKFESHRKHEEVSDILEQSIENIQENTKNVSINENGVIKTEDTLSDYVEEKIFKDQGSKFQESASTATNQINQAAVPEKFSQQNFKTQMCFSQQSVETEKSNIPNMISFPLTEPKSVSVCHEPTEKTENAILLPELNALYWLAKCHLDFHIIEMKDAPLHSSNYLKTYINVALENQEQEKSLEQHAENEKMNKIEDNNKTEYLSISQDVNAVIDTAIENPMKEKVEDLDSDTTSTPTEIVKNEYFWSKQNKSEEYVTQNEATKNTGSLSKIQAEGGEKNLADQEQPANQNPNTNTGTDEVTENHENDLTLPNEKIVKPKYQNKITSSLHIILVNETDEHIMSDSKSPHQMDQVENTSHTEERSAVTEPNGLTVKDSVPSLPNHIKVPDITDMEQVTKINGVSSNITDMKQDCQQNISPLLVDVKIENLSPQDEVSSTSEVMPLNGEEEYFQVYEGTIENQTSESINSTVIENMINKEIPTLLNHIEKSIKEIERNIPSAESGHGTDAEKRLANNKTNKSTIKKQNLIENIENVKSEDFPLNGNEDNILQISKHQLVFKPNTLGKEKNRSELIIAPDVEDDHEIEGYKKTKENSKNESVSEIFHLNGNQNEKQDGAMANGTAERSTASDDLEGEHSENNSNELQKIQGSDASQKLHQSHDPVPLSQFENSAILENSTTNLADTFDEPHLHLQTRAIENVKEELTEIVSEEDTKGQTEDLYTSSLETEAQQYLTEGVVSTIDQAELVAQLIQLKFDRSQSIDAANECSNVHSAIVYLQQECHLCTEKFSMKQMISLLECEHKCCQECAKQFFSLQINEKSIEHCVCPFCEEPKLQQLDSDAIFNYFSNMDILLKTILEPQTHELFQQKLRDRTLMQDPSFKWCAKCSFGFIADLDQKRLSCPSCKAVSCANCGQLWTKEHHGKSCEQYTKWLATQNDSSNQLVNYLEENGVTCPKCDTKFILVKGGCMHLTCSHCKYEFCSDCLKPFSMGADCKQSDYCAKLGLHAHHPRNCLFYLRDKEPGELKQLLLENNIELNLQKSKEKRCTIQLQKETDEGLIDTKCNALVEEGGLCRCHLREYLSRIICRCNLETINLLTLDDLETVVIREGKKRPPRGYGTPENEYYNALYQVLQNETKSKTHYIEYLASLIRKNKIDPVTILDLTEILQELRRQGKSLPIRSANSFEHEYRRHCIEMVKEEIPLG